MARQIFVTFVAEINLSSMKRILISLFALVVTLGSEAAEPFVCFKSSADVISLQDASVSFDNDGYVRTISAYPVTAINGINFSVIHY